MSKERLIDVLKSPHFTEKTTLGAEKNRRYAFQVSKTANKIEVKQAVEMMFNVKVSSVSTVNIKGKSRRFGRIIGSLKSYKKAYVTLQEGFEIELSEAV